MKLFRGKIYNIIRTALFLALGTLVLVFTAPIVAHLKYFIGALLIFYGAEETLYTVFNTKKHYAVGVLYWNVFEIVIGITLIAFVKVSQKEVLYAIVCVCWATWSILRETRELVDATEKFKKRITSVPNILESLVMIAFSVLMIISPTEHHAKLHIYLLSLEAFSKVLFPIFDELFAVRKGKKAEGHSSPEETAHEEYEEDRAEAFLAEDAEPLQGDDGKGHSEEPKE